MSHLVVAAADLTGVATNLAALLEKVGGVLLIVFVAFKAFGHIAQDHYGKALGLVVIALIPALFLFDPTGAEALIKNTANAIAGTGG
jgi:hypothetical protein